MHKLNILTNFKCLNIFVHFPTFFRFKELFEQCAIGYTDFIRTTDEKHKVAVETFWNTLLEKGYIYKGTIV